MSNPRRNLPTTKIKFLVIPVVLIIQRCSADLKEFKYCTMTICMHPTQPICAHPTQPNCVGTSAQPTSISVRQVKRLALYNTRCTIQAVLRVF